MEGNLTKGPILKTLTKLAIPIMASSFLGTLYNITDMAWIGLLGAKAVAGVGVGGMFTWLSQGLASMARMGGQVQIAQCIGRGEKEKAHGYAQTAMQLALLMGLAYGIIVALFANQLVGFFKLDDAETLSAALDYTKIACGFIVFSFLSFTLTGIYTAQGDSKTPFIANLFGLAANMILDPVLILGPGPFQRFGAAGAAMATVLAQVIVTMIMLFGVILQKKENVLKGLRLFVKIPLEYVQGISVIKSFNMAEKNLSGIEKAYEKSMEASYALERDFAPMNVAYSMVFRVAACAIILVSQIFALGGELDFSSLAVILIASFSIFNSVEVMGQMTAMIRSMEASLDRVERIKGEKNIDDGGGDISLKSYDIVFDHVSFSYEQGTKILDDVSFTIPAVERQRLTV